MKINNDYNDVSWHSMTMQEIFDYLGTSYDGLTSENVINNLHMYGYNVLAKSKRKSRTRLFLNQINNFLILLLLILLFIKHVLLQK
jgi:magnesium-transporting ATPase (P-type)